MFHHGWSSHQDDFVDKDDPFSLHLLYIGAMKAIVNGDYPISRMEARDLAGIQMQVVYGDHDPKKHKPGWIEYEMPGSLVFV